MRILITKFYNAHNQPYIHRFLEAAGHTVTSEQKYDDVKDWSLYDLVFNMPRPLPSAAFRSNILESIAVGQRRMTYHDDVYFWPKSNLENASILEYTDVLCMDKQIWTETSQRRVRNKSLLSSATEHYANFWTTEPELPKPILDVSRLIKSTVYMGQPKSDRLQVSDVTYLTLKSHKSYVLHMRNYSHCAFMNSPSHFGNMTPRLWESMLLTECRFIPNRYQLRDWTFYHGLSTDRETRIAHQAEYIKRYAANQLQRSLETFKL